MCCASDAAYGTRLDVGAARVGVGDRHGTRCLQRRALLEADVRRSSNGFAHAYLVAENAPQHESELGGHAVGGASGVGSGIRSDSTPSNSQPIVTQGEKRGIRM